MPDELINIDKRIDEKHKELMEQMNLALSHCAMTIKELRDKAAMCNQAMQEFVELMNNQVDSTTHVKEIV